MSSKALLHKYLGTAAQGGYALFFEPGTSTQKTTFASDYTTAATTQDAAGTQIEITSDGWLKTYLVGDYDMDVFTSAGTQISSASADGINPQAASSQNVPNLVVNGSFETDTNSDGTPDGWLLTDYTGSTNGRVSSDQRHGANCMQFTSTGSGGGFIISEEFIEVNTDVTQTFGFSIISTDAGVRNLVEILWYDESQASISTTTIYDEDTTNPTSWTRYTFQATPPADANYCKVRLYGCHSSDSTSGTTRYDDVQLFVPIISSQSLMDDFSAAYTLVLSDAGRTKRHPTTDSNARTLTIPLNATVPFPNNIFINVINEDSNDVTVTATGAATTLLLDGTTPADGDVTIGEGGIATFYYVGSDVWYAWGNNAVT